ncbi:ATP-binding cassette domain-containing protein [Saccharopolyspora sp. NPDC002376]
MALLGPNGAGKTTLVELIVGLLHAQEGTVRIDGGDPRKPLVRKRLGVVQQSIGFPNALKVGELVTGAAVRGGFPRSAAALVLAELGLTDLVRRRAAKLSGGQQQRVQLAMAQVLAERRARGAGVLVTTHLIEEAAAVADRVVVLNRGRVLAADSPDALTARLSDRTVIARTALDSAMLERMPGVVSVAGDGDLVRLRTREPEALLRHLLAADPTLSDLRVEGAGLEEALIGLTEEVTA